MNQFKSSQWHQKVFLAPHKSSRRYCQKTLAEPPLHFSAQYYVFTDCQEPPVKYSIGEGNLVESSQQTNTHTMEISLSRLQNLLNESIGTKIRLQHREPCQSLRSIHENSPIWLLRTCNARYSTRVSLKSLINVQEIHALYGLVIF